MLKGQHSLFTKKQFGGRQTKNSGKNRNGCPPGYRWQMTEEKWPFLRFSVKRKRIRTVLFYHSMMFYTWTCKIDLSFHLWIYDALLVVATWREATSTYYSVRPFYVTVSWLADRFLLLLLSNWKFNFPLTPHLRPLVLLVGRLVLIP